ncbi:ELMO/CED-12 family-domain-containing protein [Roridomyces roridus]|uniref:ELMO/CED-12 family-domain-containing protein n=1 Tax=Roridomyces roridus TaxID=1738132 RepID=A0AAD7BJJ7_9AGAR|nr:ELMO/CED-12 family-domain-containing protein [Roridomyces roridus]
MSTGADTRTAFAAAPAVNGTASSAVPLVPTNTVTTASGLTVRTRIDPVLTVDDVVKQLCINLKIKEPPSNFALRDETDELVTNDNLRRKIKTKVNLKLVNAPSREARETAEKLRLKDDATTLKLTLFTLQKYIREEEFAQEFINRAGLSELIQVIFTAHGNTLAYALTAMQNLMELDYGWATLDDAFIFQVVQILSSPQSLINVCRPATAILKKLVEADPSSAPGIQPGSSRGPIIPPPGSVYRYGFSVVFEQMRKGRGFLETVISRLGSADTAMTQYSMMLINSLLSHASDNRWEEFISELERLNVRKAVVRLMSSHTIEDLTSSILDFQANIIRVTYRKKTTLVDELEPSHSAALGVIWGGSKLTESVDESGSVMKWRLLGFDSENLEFEFNDAGVLGLECLKKLVESDPDFSKIILEQRSRPPTRRCPVAKASNEVVEMLSEHWAIFAPGYSTSTTFQPFFLDFYRVHSLAIHFFMRMWGESGAASGDFTRVAALVRSQAKVALRSENVRPWHEVEHEFKECEYRSVRERQMKELELEDDLLSKIPVRNLRAKLYKESFEFVRQQRIQCLIQGAWFMNALPPNSVTPRRPNRPWRFMRLDPGLKFLHYVDSTLKFAVRSGLEDLPERIEVAAISEIATGTCAAPAHVLRDQSDLPPTSPLIPSPLSFSLLSAHEGSLADQIAPDPSRWADWTDGLNMLRRDGGHVSSKETAGFVQALTEIGLKIKLLDLSGEMVEIPSGLVAGPPPSNTDFFFSELM